jgi:hypothetical protein
MSIPFSQEVPDASADIDAFLPEEEALDRIRHEDSALIIELATRNREPRPVRSLETGLDYYCGELAGTVRKNYDQTALDNLENFLHEQGTLDIPIVRGKFVTADGVRRDVSLVAATETGADGANHGEMSSMLYLRDQIQTASAMMELFLCNPHKYDDEGQLGKELLVSALHLMSTPSQLQRFDDVIKRGPQAGQADWPQISLYFDDLEGTKPNGWRNKQDTLQMLAYTTLDAIDRGYLTPDELAGSNKRFLSAIVPFLKAVGYPLYENSGSWEEVAARRTSVMSIETALLDKIRTMTSNSGKVDFIKAGQKDFDETVENMFRDGLNALGARLPYESPDYDSGSIKHRTADAALAYVLRYDIPRLLAENRVPIAKKNSRQLSASEIENIVLFQLRTLFDKETNGMLRYCKDSYQRTNFHTNETQLVVKAIKEKVKRDAEQRGGEIDLEEKQDLRDRFTPEGKSPAWTHPLAQIAAWAGKRSRQELEHGDKGRANGYRIMSTRYLNRLLATVTGSHQIHAVLDDQGRYRPREVPTGKLPECIITYQKRNGTTFHVPSPHTPLNWSTAMLKEALGMLPADLSTDDMAD